MISECLDLSLCTDRRELIGSDIFDGIDTAREFQEFFPSDWTKSWEFFENILFHTFHTSTSIGRDSESMGFITCFLEEHEFTRSLFEKNGIFLSGKEYLFLTLSDRTN